MVTSARIASDRALRPASRIETRASPSSAFSFSNGASAIEDPVSFAKSVLSSYGGTMTLDAWDEVVKGRIIPEAKFRSWWDSWPGTAA